MSEPSPEALSASSKKNGRIGKTVLSVISFVLLVGAGAYFMASGNVQTKVAEAGTLAPLVFIILKAATIIVAPLEGTPLYLVARTMFGLERGFAYLVIGDLIGHAVAFAFARAFGRRMLERFLSDSQLERVDHVLGYVGTWKRFLVARIILVSFGDVLSYAAGLTKLSLFTYAWITIFITLSGAAVMIALGDILINNLVSYLIVAIFFALVPLSAFGLRIIERRLREKR